jgi:hypothetical protein
MESKMKILLLIGLGLPIAAIVDAAAMLTWSGFLIW